MSQKKRLCQTQGMKRYFIYVTEHDAIVAMKDIVVVIPQILNMQKILKKFTRVFTWKVKAVVKPPTIKIEKAYR